jgi:hypothetical protein
MNVSPDNSRPKLLTWLCIGSATFGVSWIIMFIVLIILSVKGNVPPGLFPGLVNGYLQAGYLFVLAEIFLTGLGLAGVILMWRMKKAGFYLYAITKAVIFFLPVIFIGNQHLTYPGLITTSLLITLYGTIFIRTLQQINK